MFVRVHVCVSVCVFLHTLVCVGVGVSTKSIHESVYGGFCDGKLKIQSFYWLFVCFLNL